MEIIGQEELADHVMRDVGLIAPILDAAMPIRHELLVSDEELLALVLAHLNAPVYVRSCRPLKHLRGFTRAKLAEFPSKST